jgi:hypothetical protein
MLPTLLLRLLLALSLGVLIGGAIAQLVTGDWEYILVWAIALGVAVLTGLVVITGFTRSVVGDAGKTRAPAPRWQWIVAALLLLLGLGGAVAPAAAALASGRLDAPLTGTHQGLAVSGIASAAGTSTVTELDFYPDFVLADVVNPPDHRTIDEWTYQFGRAANTGPEAVQPRNIPDQSFDMRSIDLAQVIADIPIAEKTAHIASPTDVHVGIRRDAENDGNKPTVSVFLTDKYHDATIVFDLSGVVLHRLGSAFD